MAAVDPAGSRSDRDTLAVTGAIQDAVMEARIVQLPTNEIRVDADRIVIERFIVRDPALAAIVAGREPDDRAAFIERALKIGLTALPDATVSVDVDLVRD